MINNLQSIIWYTALAKELDIAHHLLALGTAPIGVSPADAFPVKGAKQARRLTAFY